MDLQSIINSRFGIGFALTLGRIMPARLGYWIAVTMANNIAKRNDSPMIQAARTNQWVIGGETMNSDELNQAVHKALQTSARCQFDLYHNIQTPSNFGKIVNFRPETEELIAKIKERKQGHLVVGLHVSNLDIGFISLSVENLNALAISVPDPGGGYQWQNDLRESFGFEFLPASKKAIRAAREKIENNGLVVTGIDRPIPDMKYRPQFFNRPASLPVFHIMLALKTGVPIIVSATIIDENGVYQMYVSDPVEMQPRVDRNSEILYNAEAVLEVAKGYISQAPDQWAMYYPVWPEAMSEVPN